MGENLDGIRPAALLVVEYKTGIREKSLIEGSSMTQYFISSQRHLEPIYHFAEMALRSLDMMVACSK